MTNLHEIYKCSVCGNIVEVVHAGAGEMMCCGKPMHKLVAGETDGNTCHQVQRAYIKPGEPAQAEFQTCSDDVTAREYCNLHGLWQSKK